MAKFPIKYAERLPPAEGQTVRGRIDFDTGAQELWQGVARTGEHLANIGFGIMEKMRAAEEMVSESKARLAMDDIVNAAVISAETTGDAKAREQLFLKAEADLQQHATTPKSEAYRNAALADIRKKRLSLDAEFKVRELKDDFKILYQKNVERGQVDEAKSLLAGAVSTGLISRAAGVEMLRGFDVDAELARAVIQADSDPQGALTRVYHIKSEDMTAEQAIRKDSLIAHINGVINRNDAARKEIEDKAVFDLYEKAYVKNEPITFEQVKASQMSYAKKMQFWELYKKAQEEKRTAITSLIEDGSIVKFQEMLMEVELSPELISTERLLAGLTHLDKNGNVVVGYGTKNYAFLANRRDENLKPDKDPIADKYRKELARVRSAGLLGDKDDEETTERYLEMSRELDFFLRTKPTDAEAEKYFLRAIKKDTEGNVNYWFWPVLWNPNRLPSRWETPRVVEVETKQGMKPYSIYQNSLIEVDGETWQALDIENGEVRWLKPEKPQPEIQEETQEK